MRILKFAMLLIIVIFSFVFSGCSPNDNIVRIHIRANSNSEIDQDIKLDVRDGVIKFITPLIADCENGAEVKDVLNDNVLYPEGWYTITGIKLPKMPTERGIYINNGRKVIVSK